VSVPVFEVRPEVSFTKMTGAPMSASKETWAGAYERRVALEHAGITLDGDLGEAGRKAGADDVLDAAAAAAWTARRVVAGDAISLPSPPKIDTSGRPIAIWA
jgi:predicted RNase H-like nuclease